MASIAAEQAANARAMAEGYASAAAKETHANARASADGYANAVQKEIDANRRAQAAGFANAAEQEIDANRRSVEAGFLNAADQEIDANRRARAAGWLNAADYESGLRTRSNLPFLDPRVLSAPAIPSQFAYRPTNFSQPNMPSGGLLGYQPPAPNPYPPQPTQDYFPYSLWDMPSDPDQFQPWTNHNYPQKKRVNPPWGIE